MHSFIGPQTFFSPLLYETHTLGSRVYIPSLFLPSFSLALKSIAAGGVFICAKSNFDLEVNMRYGFGGEKLSGERERQSYIYGRTRSWFDGLYAPLFIVERSLPNESKVYYRMWNWILTAAAAAGTTNKGNARARAFVDDKFLWISISLKAWVCVYMFLNSSSFNRKRVREWAKWIWLIKKNCRVCSRLETQFESIELSYGPFFYSPLFPTEFNYRQYSDERTDFFRKNILARHSAIYNLSSPSASKTSSGCRKTHARIKPCKYIYTRPRSA